MKVEGSNITITDSVYNKMSIIPKGACEQEGTPTPDNPIPVKVVTGDNEVVVSNKNWLNLTLNFIKSVNTRGTWNNNVYTYNGVTYTINEDLTISTSGTASSNSNLNLLYKSANNYSNKYLSGCASGGANDKYFLNLAYLNSEDVFQTEVREIGSGIQINDTYPKISIVLYIVNGFNSNGLTFKPMIANASGEIYAPHQEQTTTLHLGTEYLAGIGDYKDEIVGKTNEWKIRRYVGSEIFDGTNVGFTVNGRIVEGSYTTVNRSRSYYKKLDNNNQYGCMCNKMKSANINQTYAGQKNSIALGGNGNYVQACFDYSVGTNYQEINTWLQSNNLKVYYLLATPTEETITDTTLITDLNNMYQAMGYDGTTNITITSAEGNAQMTAEVTYTSESDMCEKLLFIFNKMKDKLYHIIRSL